jgi:hypothetical protein
MTEDVKKRWNLHHDVLAVVAQLYLPAAERAEQLRRYADGLLEFQRTATPRESLQQKLEEARAAADAAAAGLAQARTLLGVCGLWRPLVVSNTEYSATFASCDGCHAEASKELIGQFHEEGADHAS